MSNLNASSTSQGSSSSQNQRMNPYTNPYSSLQPRKRKRNDDDGEYDDSNGGNSPVEHSSNPANVAAAARRPFAPARKSRRQGPSNYTDSTIVDTRGPQPRGRAQNPGQYKRSELQGMGLLKTFIQECVTAKDQGRNLEPSFQMVRERIHMMEVFDFIVPALVTDSRILGHPGLGSIIEGQDGITWPWDIIADARVLGGKWVAGNLDPFLLEGIIKKTKSNGLGRAVHTRSIDPNYPKRVSSHYVGAGDLTNGQWWPYQICAARDGAHGEIEAGISGTKGIGAFSIVLSHGGYADIDEGDTIRYCGTSGGEGKPSFGTSLMQVAQTFKHVIRVFRSSTLTKNKYKPKKGLRYDGLYEIVSSRELDRKTSMVQFTLQRVAGQEPIRYEGAERRPTDEQLKFFERTRELEGLST